MMNIAKEHKVNEQIRVRQIRLIGAEGEQVGIIDTREAMNMAREAGVDLVMVSPQAVPPVCRLLDYGRFRFEQQQNERENRKRARGQEVKAIKFRVKIDGHDFNTKTGHVRRFLEEGHKVKVTIMFRGRERTHPELGERILVRVAETLADIGVPESNPSMMGMDMNMIMTPRVAPAPKKERGDEDMAAPAPGGTAPSASQPQTQTSQAQSSEAQSPEAQAAAPTADAPAPAEAPASA
ncbi:translation initiation factor IF-3 [Deinococcus arenicola]|uniref:Translation initiation factor IF-3 n=1 Tax=Deinococcus arenicola TaxID=2994950 RepID=A0ABU4DPG6_9DEIO|nr:translation initiation factor IF-3 [Deinococcus sp. ZS9-10]MDV6374320.1 translation initiation factor IF-3 [Deinococcus sp. ZS9-10]